MKTLEFDNYSAKGVIREFLTLMIENNCSDMHIQPRQKIILERHDVYHAVSHIELELEDVQRIAEELYGSETATALTMQGKAYDQKFDLKHRIEGELRSNEYHFRINVSTCWVRGRLAPSITIRKIDPDPPEWSKMGYGEDLWLNFRPPQGLVLVTGPTGSGKSTLLASGIRRILAERENEKIITAEDPIEYIHDRLKGESNIVSQSSIPECFPTYVEAMKYALRRRPTIIMLGEARDQETIRTMVYAALTGHLVYSTAHTNGVPETLKRLLNEFPHNEHSSRLGDIVNQSRLYVSQRLLPSTDGKRVAIREVLVFDREVRAKLETANISNISSVARKVTNSYGQSMVEHALKYHKEGLITDRQFKEIEQEFSREDV